MALTIDVGTRLSGILRVGKRDVELEEISGIYLRSQDRAAFRAFSDGEARVGAALDDLLLVVAELAPGVILNRPDAMASNGSKPYQYSLIRSVGFTVPNTLITTSPEAAREFVALHDSVIYKSVSGVRSIVGELREAGDARLFEVRWCPTQLQERIAGIDVRVHVVGKELFACEIRCEAVDYRYAHLTGHNIELSRCQLPDDCAERCLALARATRLPLAGIDLRRTEEGEWYCFEINPSPGFTYYQNATGAPIDAAIAKLLATPYY
jgi:glutathione synthase/RimK-type ligase-like ATP-grasp enzyme